MTKLFTIALALGVYFTSYGQNLVPNPSFEEVSDCPRFWSEKPEDLTALHWVSPTQATPDNFKGCSKTSGVPNNWAGIKDARTGQAYAGFIARRNFGLDTDDRTRRTHREYLQTKLLEPLQAGRTYEVTFYVSLAENCRVASDQLQVAFTRTQIGHEGRHIMAASPQVTTQVGTVFKNTTGWDKVTATFKATGGEEYMTIGNYSSNKGKVHEEVYHKIRNDGKAFGFAYYFIDDVSVTLIETEEDRALARLAVEKAKREEEAKRLALAQEESRREAEQKRAAEEAAQQKAAERDAAIAAARAKAAEEQAADEERKKKAAEDAAKQRMWDYRRFQNDASDANKRNGKPKERIDAKPNTTASATRTGNTTNSDFRKAAPRDFKCQCGVCNASVRSGLFEQVVIDELDSANFRVGQRLDFNMLEFDINSSEIKRVSEGELLKLVFLLQEMPELEVEIVIHMDVTRDDDHCRELSKATAVSIYNFLRSRDVKNKILYNGFGKTHTPPLNGRQRDRTIELIIRKI